MADDPRQILINEGETDTREQFSSITLNLEANKAAIRHDRMEGRDHLVVPCVMMTTGVHKGSQGALYYPEEELSKTPAVWNGKPVVVYHPQLNGAAVSACDPTIYDKQKIGELMNTHWDEDGGRLRTECWIEEDKTREVDDRVLEALEEGRMMEVSTGLFSDNAYGEGEWNGEAYQATARNYRPDHLAVLPDRIGACSIEDGAGLLRNQEGVQEVKDKLKGWVEDGLDMALQEALEEAVQNQARKTDDGRLYPAAAYAYVPDPRKPSTWKLRLWETPDKKETPAQIGRAVAALGKGFRGQRVQLPTNAINAVKAKIRAAWRRVNPGKAAADMPRVLRNEKEDGMDWKDLVDDLIANEESPWSEDDREKLMALEGSLGNLQEEAADEEKEETGEGEGEETTPNQNEGEPVTLAEFLVNASPEDRDAFEEMKRAHDLQKTTVIEQITANEKNPFSKEQLQAKKLDELRQLAVLAEGSPKSASKPNYSGQGQTAPSTNQGGEAALVAPTLSFEKE